MDDAYRFPGFRPLAKVRGIFGNPKARVVRLQRRGKKRAAAFAGEVIGLFTITRFAGYETSPAATRGSTWRWEIRRVDCRSCAAVKQEKLAWLADNPFYTERFAFFVGRRCRTATVKDVARELHLDWKTVKEL